MSHERHTEVKEIFAAAVRLPPEGRRDLLDEACGDDLELRAEVEELLRFHDDASVDTTSLRVSTPAPTPPAEVGVYRPLRKIGEEGMGEVFEAVQERPVRRTVALKPSELASDIERHLANQPILARPPGVTYLLRKFIGRNRVAVAAALIVLAALLIGIIGTGVGFLRARREAESARRVSDVMVSMYNDLNPNIVRGQVATPEAILDRAVERIQTELAAEPLVQARLPIPFTQGGPAGGSKRKPQERSGS